MIRIPRWLVGVLGILFASFHAVLGFSTLGEARDKNIALFALIIYLASIYATILLYKGVRLPLSQAILNLAAAALIPILVNTYLEPAEMSSYSTWYVLGIATLMSATAIRQQRIIAWAGTAILVIQVITWAGIQGGIHTGLLGAVMLVFAGHAISVGLARAYKETMEFNQQALEIELQQTANAVAGEVRRSRLENALIGAMPMLETIRDQRGQLDETQKFEAKLLEASLRDEIRGRELLNAQVRTAVRNARKRGIEVILLDEGGLQSIGQSKKQEILKKVAEAIDGVSQGRVTLRAPEGESWCVTLFATRPGVATPDVWLKF